MITRKGLADAVAAYAGTETVEMFYRSFAQGAISMQAGKTYVLAGVMVRKWKQNGIAQEPAYLERSLQSSERVIPGPMQTLRVLRHTNFPRTGTRTCESQSKISEKSTALKL